MQTLHAGLAFLGGLVVAFPAGAQSYGDSAMAKPSKPQVFAANLSGTKEVPAVNTIASGTAKFTVKNDSTLTFVITLNGAANVTAAHIHLGAPGATGEPVATLIQGKAPGGKATGTITPKDLHGTTMAQLITAMQTGQAYVNVHTAAHPDGELRGDIGPAESSTVSQVTR